MGFLPANVANGAAGNASGAVVSANQCDALLRRALAARRYRRAEYPALRRAYLDAVRMRRDAMRGAGSIACAANMRRTPGRIYAAAGQMQTRINRNNRVIASGPTNNKVHTAGPSAARHRATLAMAQAKLTGWNRDLYRAVTVYTRLLEKARERAARGLTDGANLTDNTSYRRVRHAPAAAVDAIHAGSIGMATPPDRVLSR